MSDQWMCTKCDWHGNEDEINKDEYFKRTHLEPSDWIWHCPICYSPDHLEEDHGFWCRHCQDVPVQDDDDLCPECYAEEVERYTDISLGH